MNCGTMTNMYRLTNEVPEEDNPLGIPYSRTDSLSHDYVDLKVSPELAKELPELQKSPLINDVVMALTLHTSLRTLGCEVWPVTHPWTGTPWAGYDYRVQSYLDIAFDDERRNNREAYNELIEEFITSKKAPPKTHVVLQHKRIIVAPQPYLGLIWWNFGAGRTEEEAQEAWTLGMTLFKEFALEKYPLQTPLR